jgi:arginine decarboxylase
MAVTDKKWTVQDSLETYNVAGWGKGYFSVNEAGHVVVHPDKNPARGLDLKDLVDSLKARGLQPPLLLRFGDILKHRVNEIAGAFRTAMTENGYGGEYCCVYPIKVNQQRHVVEEYIDYAKPHKFGLEAGSKPELLAVLAMTTGAETPIICNGFKDDEFIECVMLAQKMGKTIIPVVEKFTELELICEYAAKLGVRPKLGVRVKLAARGSGRWESSGGFRSKFGLTVTEVLQTLDYLKERGFQDGLQLLHFHLGSQITNIRNIKGAITECARVYVELARAGADMKYIDVGGGLGIDYDGSQTNFESSVNYTLQEYANDVVFRIKQVCDDAEVRHPVIITESGRAVMAYHSVLVFNVLGVARYDKFQPPAAPAEDFPQPVHDLFATFRDVTKKNLLESYHDAGEYRDQALDLFNLGHLSLAGRSLAESLYWAICMKILKLCKDIDYVPEELEGLQAQVSDIYFCNYSIFQSMPDAWAIKQLFPIMPIHRLGEEPSRRGVLADISCDSDGKIDKFIDLRDVKSTLELHPFDGSDYFLAAFLVGAYQEILGDLHNLLGDTNAVHVSLDDDGEISIDAVVKGDSCREVLSYVQYNPDELLAKMRKDVEASVRRKEITVQDSAKLLRFYESSLEGYTYLEEPHVS